MAYKRRKYTTQVLQTHAQRHRLKLVAFENITPETLEAAKELICEAARRLAVDYKPNSKQSYMAVGDGLTVVVACKRILSPFLCRRCQDEQQLRDSSMIVDHPINAKVPGH